MESFTDQLGRTISLPHPPQKIISLVPSITELLCYLGLEERLSGITRYCIFPGHLIGIKTVVGGTKKTVASRVHALAPDLILASKEENIREETDAYAQDHPVWVSDVKDLDDALQMIGTIGEMTHTRDRASLLVTAIRNAFGALPHGPARSGAYLIWKAPFMTVGGDTFIHHMMHYAGIRNVFGDAARYPAVTLEEIAARRPDVLLLSSEPYPFKEEHVREIGARLPGVRILLADGTFFSWYGSRLLHAPGYFLSDILPAIAPKE